MYLYVAYDTYTSEGPTKKDETKQSRACSRALTHDETGRDYSLEGSLCTTNTSLRHGFEHTHIFLCIFNPLFFYNWINRKLKMTLFLCSPLSKCQK